MKRRILIWGLIIIGLFFSMIGIYELMEKKQAVDPVVHPDESNVPEGYEEEEELIQYMVYQIQNNNLEAALRGCAVQELAEYFSMDAYIRHLERFEGTDLLPPSDTESPAYRTIAKAELARRYSAVLKRILKIQEQKGSFEFLGMKEDVPENPDGMYYQIRDMVCEILGSRSVSEIIIYLGDGAQVYELRCTLARYKKYWKLLTFHEIQDSGIKELSLRESEKDYSDPISLAEYQQAVLPQNYDMVTDCKEEDPEYMIRRFFLYLQREDALSALAYMDIYRDGGSYDDGTDTMFKRQGVAAQNLQAFYYRILFIDDDYYNWIMRDLDDRSAELVTQLSTTNMLFTNLKRIVKEKNDGKEAVYKVKFLYNYKVLTKRVHMIYRTDGWKIQSIR